jgi:predicted CXXCH cytochrome family protein
MRYSSLSRYVLPLLVIVGFALIGAVLVEASSPARQGPSQGTQSCATCHVDVVNAWQTGTHAQAYADPVFQEAWEKQGKGTECLACHTTGYSALTGKYTHEGVTCEACHGVPPANHPAEPMAVDPGVETCAGCHTTTFSEWQQSKHGAQQLACTTCHLPHPQTLRFETVQQLCLNCHDADARDDYAHLVHAERECTDCHWFEGDQQALIDHGVSGNLFPTGHSTKVETRACVSCHAEMTTNPAVQEGEQAREELGLTSQHPLIEAQVRIEELEAEVNTVKAQGSNTSALRLAQGVVLGAAFGGLVVLGVLRLRRRNAANGPVKPHKP